MPTIQLKKIPSELYSFILKIQGETKVNTGKGVYSQESTVIAIIKEYKKILEKK